LEAHLESLTAGQPRPKLTAGFDEAAIKLTALHKHVADSAHFLPAFDARQAQEVKSVTAAQPPFLVLAYNHEIFPHKPILIQPLHPGLQKLKALQANIDAKRDELIPKKKFAFKVCHQSTTE
jgi:hypothetical protein